MANGDLDIQVEALNEGAERIKAEKIKMYEYINEVVSVINGVNWSGPARDSFDSALNAMRTRFTEADGVIESYAQFLNDAAQNYIENESNRATDNQSFDGGQ